MEDGDGEEGTDSKVQNKVIEIKHKGFKLLQFFSFQL